MIVAGLLLAPAGAAPPPVASETSIGLVMVFVLLTYGGWNEAVYLSAELKGGRSPGTAILKTPRSWILPIVVSRS